MSNRRSPSGPRSSVTGFIALAQTVVAPGSAGNVATATGILAKFRAPGSTVAVPVDPRRLTTNDAQPGRSANFGIKTALLLIGMSGNVVKRWR